MIILAPVAMLAVTRIGAVLNTVFGGFSSTALAARVLDCGSKLIITADSVMRGPKPVDLKKVCVFAGKSSVLYRDGCNKLFYKLLSPLPGMDIPHPILACKHVYPHV